MRGRLERAQEERRAQRDVLEVTSSRVGGGEPVWDLDLRKLGRVCCSLKTEQDFGILKEPTQRKKSVEILLRRWGRLDFVVALQVPVCLSKAEVCVRLGSFKTISTLCKVALMCPSRMKLQTSKAKKAEHDKGRL